MAKLAARAPADKLALYEKLIATHPDVERKGATMPYTSLNGHMFSFLDPKGKMGLRLPERELDAFQKKYKTRRPVQYGAVMKEYAEVPDALLAKTAELKKYFRLSRDYVAGLKPKATAKTQAATALAPTPKAAKPGKTAKPLKASMPKTAKKTRPAKKATKATTPHTSTRKKVRTRR